MSMTSAHSGWVATDAAFGARLALIRQRMGWGNTKEAALACGLPVQSWRGWERDNRAPRDFIGTCQKIADATGCDLIWLAGLDGTRPKVELPRLDSNQQPSGYQIRRVA
jgi:transcriptional regulator with XRE-family HTH domain